MAINLRIANSNDASEIATLTQELGYGVSEKETLEWLSVLLGSNTHQVIVAADNDSRLLGWIVVEQRLSLEAGLKAEISGLVVRATAQRSGVGRQLVSAAEEWATTMGLAQIQVRSNILRKDSHPFYLSLGYMHKKTAHSYAKGLQLT
ncbi:MAG: GNAT family N-acetyltransferase [Candidatus Competibacteraceae bacterium]|nr:GNAT family N-acetyltransferase [Candidatus Competibacteraceae bacterium]MBK7983553.1 GNAT family N-acetyltransferase [Candidatus Competibacteraceae bacterium]MBK8897907.1 GNAT family N-acetyltransferase [Candidatus Competibacteraceae bacterium]MBK9950929.1 GNAT family N-acetyltransferase [Candidatus Competibacteraceae bacterium]